MYVFSSVTLCCVYGVTGFQRYSCGMTRFVRRCWYEGFDVVLVFRKYWVFSITGGKFVVLGTIYVYHHMDCLDTKRTTVSIRFKHSSILSQRNVSNWLEGNETNPTFFAAETNQLTKLNEKCTGFLIKKSALCEISVQWKLNQTLTTADLYNV